MRQSFRVLSLAIVFLSAEPADAQESRWTAGARGGITAADGEPANDIPSVGAFVRYRFGSHWSAGFAVDSAEYDFEEPAKLLGLEQDQSVDVIDASAESTVISAWLEREHRSGRAVSFFWGAGAGIGSVDADEVSGPLEGGGTFDIVTDAGDEFIATALGGVRWNISRRWILELELRADQHFADWQMTDRVSGRTGTIDDYLAIGGNVGVGFRF